MKREIVQMWISQPGLPALGGVLSGKTYLGPETVGGKWSAILDTDTREIALTADVPGGRRTFRVPLEAVRAYRGAPTKAGDVQDS